jgi:hypothetical protein
MMVYMEKQTQWQNLNTRLIYSVTGKLAALSLSAGTVPGSTIKQQPKPHSVSDLQDAKKTGFTSADRSLFINLK